MIRHHRKQRFFAEINITPFTDVILVLLIIFMVAAPIIYQSNIKVKLPKVKAKETQNAPPDRQKSAVITVTTEGMVYLDDKLVTQVELKTQVTEMHKNNPDLSVFLRADQQTRFKDVVEVLDLLTEMGITKLDIVAVHAE
jgi:biopolymer transport protein TolR